jgi:hypothetical protein
MVADKKDLIENRLKYPFWVPLQFFKKQFRRELKKKIYSKIRSCKLYLTDTRDNSPVL